MPRPNRPHRPPRPARPSRPAVPAAIPARTPASQFDTPDQQHDLRDNVAANMVAQARPHAGEVFVEVGPGLGSLTAALLAAKTTVYAVERDAERVAHLQQRFATELAAGRLIIHHGDALRWKPQIEGPWRVLANPPFALTAALIRGWVLMDHGPVRMDLVLQREAAQKLSGVFLPSRSSVLLSAAGRPRITGGFQRDDVTPPSRVDLCWWAWTRDQQAPVPPKALRQLDRLLEKGFAGPRTISEALRGLATGVQIKRQAAEHGWNPDDHPRTLTPGAWLSLAQLLAMCGKI